MLPSPPRRYGNVLIVDSMNHTVRRMDPMGEVSTVAGLAPKALAQQRQGAPDPDTDLLVQLLYPSGVCMDNDGNVVVADADNHRVRLVSPEGRVSTLAGICPLIKVLLAPRAVSGYE